MSRTRSIVFFLLLSGAVLGLGTYWLTQSSTPNRFQSTVSVTDAMGGDTIGYRRATEARPFSFPADHGPHPEYKTEWWYVTGSLENGDTVPYGYELTIFRFALTPPDDSENTGSTGGRDWRTNQMYMAHFAVTNGADETFRAVERFARGGAGLAGAQADPFRVWIEDWSLTSTGNQTFPVRLQAQTDDASIDLIVRPEKRMVFHGNDGLSQKGPGTGHASYYYSYTRLATEGTMGTGGDTVQVEGTSWMDREWSTSALGPDQGGWDWFALQLDDGRDLMYYRLRNEDGAASRFSEGTLVAANGSTEPLRREDVTVDVLDTWTSPDGSRRYPVEWQIRIPSRDLDLHVESYLPNQEVDLSIRYWEGAVRVDGPPSGRGYVEMTGYGSRPIGSPS